MSQESFYISSSPHVHGGDSIPKIMWTVVGALLPATIWGVYAFGIRAAWISLLAVAAAMLVEAGVQRLRGRPITVKDGAAALTGLLLALNLPVSSPWWLVVFGSAIAVLLGKQVFGGLGQNPFNPALIARVVLLISFPVQMTTWLSPGGAMADAISSATALGEAKSAAMFSGGVGSVAQSIDLIHLFLGFQRGCIGEVSALCLLVGAGFLLWRKIITLDIPIGFIGATFLITAISWMLSPGQYLNPFIHLFSGGLFLGAFFMATDMVTSPLTSKGRWIFGVGCGVLTAVIRLWGGYPEGVSFSILLMNACVPLIDRYAKPKKFGLAVAQGVKR